MLPEPYALFLPTITNLDPGDDTYAGGEGVDTIYYATNRYDETEGGPVRSDVRVTIDNVADDGPYGENDNVRTDVENVTTVGEGMYLFGGAARRAAPAETNTGRAELIGSAGLNSLTGSDQNDFLDGKAGNDFTFANSGDDTIEARDGFADLISCGPGTDTANVDTLDTVYDCEVVNRVDVGNANEDPPPAVAWVAPAAGASLSGPTVLQANASDDKGVTQVAFVAGDRLVCVDTTAPYSCDYAPKGEDVGKLALIAVAFDANQQTATVVRQVTVERFDADKLTVKTKPKKDTSNPRKFTTTGVLDLPEGVTPAEACTGKVAVQIKAGKKTISTRRVALKSDCSYRSTVKFTLPKRFGKAKKLKVKARFLGNEILDPEKGKTKVRVK